MTARLRRARLAAAPVAAGLVLGLAACAEDPGPAAEVPVQQRLQQAEDLVLAAGSFRLTMTSEGLPETTREAVISASGSGSVDPPAFEGTVTARLGGIQVEVPVVALGGALHVKLPYTPDFAEVSPESVGVPDPATLFSAESGVHTLLPETDDAAYGERSRDGREIVQEVSGTLPGRPVLDLLRVGNAEAEFEVTYGLIEAEGADPWPVRSVRISGPFYPDGDSTYVLTLDRYGEAVHVEAP